MFEEDRQLNYTFFLYKNKLFKKEADISTKIRASKEHFDTGKFKNKKMKQWLCSF